MIISCSSESDSLQMLELITKCNRTFAVDIPVYAAFANPTVAGLAELCVNARQRTDHTSKPNNADSTLSYSLDIAGESATVMLSHEDLRNSGWPASVWDLKQVRPEGNF